MTIKRRVKNELKRFLVRSYKLGEYVGVHVLPVHYYSALNNLRELRATRSVWEKKSELLGIHVDLDEQMANLRRACLPYRHEYEGNEAFREGVEKHCGPGYNYIEAQALHGFIRNYKPKRIIEVGSGVSTYCMLAAIAKNRIDGSNSIITCIEPHPYPWLKQREEVRLINKPVQEVSFDVFEELGDGDFLFIDSSHAVKAGSDVNFLILEVLPRLSPNVLIHFHDIYFPYDFQRDVLKTFLHWSETSLLRAFMIHNNRIGLVFCLSHLHYERQAELEEVFPEYDPEPNDGGMSGADVRAWDYTRHFPCSTYLQIREDRE